MGRELEHVLRLFDTQRVTINQVGQADVRVVPLLVPVSRSNETLVQFVHDIDLRLARRVHDQHAPLKADHLKARDLIVAQCALVFVKSTVLDKLSQYSLASRDTAVSVHFVVPHEIGDVILEFSIAHAPLEIRL